MFRQDAYIANPMPFGPQWVIDKQLGRGSYGAVYQVSRHDAGEAILSAMKWIPLPGDEQEVRVMKEKGLSLEQIRAYYDRVKSDFVGEIQLLYKLRGNSHVVSIEDYRIEPRSGEDAVGYDIYILMELLTPLPKWLDHHPNCTFSDILRLGKDLCDALADCAKLSVLHRDIKPDNIFVTADGRFKLGDFGIARRLERDDINASQRVGNLGTMSPEVFHSQNYDQRADLYSLGLVLYRLTNEKREPFTPPYPEAVTPDVAAQANRRRLAGEALPRPVNLPGSLDRLWDVIQIACAYNPENRYQSAGEMRQALLSLDSLPALDTVVSSYRRTDTAEKSPAPPAAERPSDLSGTSDRTLHRSRSSFSDLNSTVGRHSSSAYRSDPESPAHTEEPPEPEEAEPPKRRKLFVWLIPVACVILACVLITVILSISGHKGKSSGGGSNEAARANPELLVDQKTPTSVTISWLGLPGDQFLVSCYNGETCVRRIRADSSPCVIDGLVPSHTYRFTVQPDGSETVLRTEDIITPQEETLTEAPMVFNVLVEKVSSVKLPQDYSEGVPDVDNNDFKTISDRSIVLRAAPLTIKTQSYVYNLNVSFKYPGISSRTELVTAIVLPDNTTFSRGYVLNPSDSEGTGSLLAYRIPLDEILRDIYAAYSHWPTGKVTLGLYLDGMSAFACDINLKNDAGV